MDGSTEDRSLGPGMGEAPTQSQVLAQEALTERQGFPRNH